MSNPRISVVTLTWNSTTFVEPLLDSLLHDIDESGVTTEVIVVDNGSSDDTPTKVRGYRAKHDNICLVPLGTNHGTTVSRNVGIRMARGDYIFILDSDTEIPPGTLGGLMRAFEDIPDPETIALVHPRLVYPDGEFQESARRFPTVFTKTFRLLQMDEMRARDESIQEVIDGVMTPVDYAISAAWMVPRSTFDRVGLFDEEIFYAPEDVEFCARCWEHGLKVWYYPYVEVVHNCQRITNRRPLSRLGFSHAKGLVRYWRRYRSFLSRRKMRE